MAEASYSKSRAIAPFFEDAINQVFLQSDKQVFIMDGPIALGKTTNFLWMGSYGIAQCVEPVKRGGKMVRESLWLGISESENSAVARFKEAIEDATFAPDVMSNPNGPVKIHGSHPAYITIQHGLSDGTELKMVIECRGFNHEAAEGVLRSRSYLGALIPECQTVPWNIIEVARQRTGRWRPSDVRITKVINGKSYTLTGIAQLKIVLCDANIPTRPHMMYDRLYDNTMIDESEYLLLTPPSPVIPLPIADASPELLANPTYPKTRFERKDVVWIPNPACYFMTVHFEKALYNEDGTVQVDANGNMLREAWSGYSTWYQELHQSDSVIRRHVMGKPDTVGGDEAVYPTFSRDIHVGERAFRQGEDVWVGYDPGNHAAVVFMQMHPDNHVHVFYEIIFAPSDALTSRGQVEQFVNPYVESIWPGSDVKFVTDPFAEVDTNQGEGLAAILRSFKHKVIRCLVPNQNTVARVEDLAYFVDQGKLTIDPRCTHLIMGMSGGFAYKKLRSGKVSDVIDKDSIYSHVVEALQYPIVNLYIKYISKPARRAKSKTGIHKLRRKKK